LKLNYIFFLSIFLILFIYTPEIFGDDDSILDLEKHAKHLIDEPNYVEALEYLDRILEIDPNNTNALNNKGGIMINLGNHSAAINFFDSVLEINGNNTEALNNKAIALYKQENYIESLENFYKSLQTDSTNQFTINNTKNVVKNLYWIDETENAYAVVSIRDENNKLVSYSKIDKVSVQPPLGYIFLEQFGNKTNIEINGKNTNVVEYSTNLTFEKTQYVGTGGLILKIGNDFQMMVVEFLLNGFIVTEGDTIEYRVIIIDPTF